MRQNKVFSFLAAVMMASVEPIGVLARLGRTWRCKDIVHLRAMES